MFFFGGMLKSPLWRQRYGVGDARRNVHEVDGFGEDWLCMVMVGCDCG